MADKKPSSTACQCLSKKTMFFGLILCVLFYLLVVPLSVVARSSSFSTFPVYNENNSLIETFGMRDFMVNFLGNGNTTPVNNVISALQSASKPGSRKDLCDGCFKHDFKYLLNSEKICKTGNDSKVIDLLLVVTTIHKNFKSRHILRNSWLSASKNNTANIRYVFLFGKTNDTELQKKLVAEASVYNDIVQEDFIDAYRNLTYKTIMGLKWATKFCMQARYVMKTDDDMWINVPVLLNSLDAQYKPLDIVYGACWSGAPHRHTHSKWYVPEHLYPHKKYPMFCSGTGYVMKNETAEKIWKASEDIPFFYLEDVYVGLCLRYIGGQAINTKGFYNNKASNPCTYRGKTIITSHYLRMDFITGIWNSKC